MRSAAAIASFLALFFWFTLSRLNEPELNADEAYAAAPATAMLDGAPRCCGFYYLKLGSLDLPLTITPYHGALESYLAAPLILAFGHTTEALRLYGVLFGAATLVLVFTFSRLYFDDERMAWGSAFLLATLPTYVFRAQMGMLFSIALLTFQVAALCCLAVWHRTSRDAYLYVGCLLLGASMACRSWAIYNIATLMALACAFQGERLRAALGDPRRFLPKILRCFLAFAVGAAPLTVHVILNARVLLSFLAERFPHSTLPGMADNCAYLANLTIRVRQSFQLAGGAAVNYDPLRAGAIAASFIGLAFAGVAARGRRPAVRTWILPLYLIIFLSVSPFTVSTLKDFHLQGLVLLSALAVALALSRVVDRFESRIGRGPCTALYVVLIILVSINGFRSLWPDPVRPRADVPSRLARWLIDERLTRCETNSPQLQWLMVYLSGGRLQPTVVGEDAGSKPNCFLWRRQLIDADMNEQRLAGLLRFDEKDFLKEFQSPRGEYVLRAYRAPASDFP